MTMEERVLRLERAVLEIAMLLDRVQFSYTASPIKWGEGTAIGDIRHEQDRADAIAAADNATAEGADIQ